MIRSKTRLAEHGQKNTSYFLNLEKEKLKRIVKLNLDDGS